MGEIRVSLRSIYFILLTPVCCLSFVSRYLATNEALMRTSVLGVVNFNSIASKNRLLCFVNGAPPQT